MKYISYSCVLFDDKKIKFRESDNSIFKDYGIFRDQLLEQITIERTFNMAGALRMALDLLELKENMIEVCQENIQPSMVRALISCAKDDDENFFELVYQLKELEHWNRIHKLMCEHLSSEWEDFVAMKDPDYVKHKDNLDGKREDEFDIWQEDNSEARRRGIRRKLESFA